MMHEYAVKALQRLKECLKFVSVLLGTDYYNHVSVVQLCPVVPAAYHMQIKQNIKSPEK